MRFRDRFDAGRQLAARLVPYAGRDEVGVLALPRGGVPVGYEVARALGVPLDVFLVRKLGVPGRQELAMGAIATGGVRVLNENLVRGLDIPAEVLEEVAGRERMELERREAAYRAARPTLDVRDRIVIVVDDGLATGATMHAAIAALRKLAPGRIVVAVPVGAPETCAEFAKLADEVICAWEPAAFYSVGAWYQDFSQTTDQEVRDLLAAADAAEGVTHSPSR